MEASEETQSAVGTFEANAAHETHEKDFPEGGADLLEDFDANLAGAH